MLISTAWIFFAAREKTRSSPAARVRVWAEVLIAVFVVVIVADQGRHFVRWWSERSYSIQEANDDLRRILGPGAVTTGEWAPPLTQMGDSPLSLTHFFSLAEAKTFFADNPIGLAIAQVYERLMEGATITVRAFNNADFAAEWLEVPVQILFPPRTADARQ